MQFVFNWHDAIGIIGVTIILVTYFLLQCDRLKSQSYLYSWLNALGSILILYSLLFEWNLAAFIIEVCWALISVFGVIKNFLHRHKPLYII